MLEDSPQAVKLGFLSYVQASGGNAGRGALLVTDDGTRPVEFRCTSPIKPNPLQRMLYGDTLRSYITVDLVGEPLLSAVQEKPVIVLVREPLFLKLRPKIKVSMVCLRRQGEQITALVNESDSRNAPEPSILDCASGRFQPLTVTTTPGHNGELQSSLEILRPIFSGIDLLEPFDRIEKVVAELERQENGASK